MRCWSNVSFTMRAGANDRTMDSSKPQQSREFYDETILTNPEIVDGERILLRAERPQVETRKLRERLAVITRRAVTVRKTIEFDVMHEELYVRYESGDATEMVGGEPETYSILLHAEEIEVVKHVRVVEEVFISTKQVAERKRFDVTLHHETLDVLDAKLT